MEMTINNFWKLFSSGVKIDQYGKLFGIREFSEQLALYLFNNPFSTDTGTPAKNIPLLYEVDDGKKVYTFHALHFSSSSSCSTEVIPISDLNIYSSSSSSYNTVASIIEYKNDAIKEVNRECGWYNRTRKEGTYYYTGTY